MLVSVYLACLILVEQGGYTRPKKTLITNLTERNFGGQTDSGWRNRVEILRLVGFWFGGSASRQMFSPRIRGFVPAAYMSSSVPFRSSHVGDVGVPRPSSVFCLSLPAATSGKLDDIVSLLPSVWLVMIRALLSDGRTVESNSPLESSWSTKLKSITFDPNRGQLDGLE